MTASRSFYSGHVQGVGFRYSVKQIAAGYDLEGYVRNLPDGRVELYLQGESAEIKDMLDGIMKSHLCGFIREVETQNVSIESSCRGFSIVS